MNRTEAAEKAIELVGKMTIEEAASQLKFDAPGIDRLGIHPYNWWNEALHGVARAGSATMFPQAIGLAAAFDPKMLRRLGSIAGDEARAKHNAALAHGDYDIYKGLTFWSPNINIFRDPRWGRGHETYGEDPCLTAELGKAYVEGLQGDGDTLKVAACAKHFAVHSGPENLRHHFDAVASPKDMEETYLPAFRELVQDAHVEAVMGAYNRTNGEPCCGSDTLIRKTLRGQWGFEGHVVSDCWAVRDFHTHHGVTARPEESVTMALTAGCNLNCGCTYEFVMSAYHEGLISEELIRDSAVKLFTTRYLLGEFDGSEYDTIPYEVVECPEHLAEARRAAEKSCVLLKNDGILPLDISKYKTIGVIGPNANSRSALIGNYHGTASRYITVLEGLQDAIGDEVRILYSEGCHLFRKNVEGLGQADDRLSEAVTVAEHADLSIVVVGLDETLEGEEGDAGNADASGDKKDLLLPESQRRLLDAVLRVGKPVVLCLMVGSAIDLGEAADRANAILLPWYPGAQGGRAVANILTGKVSPSGKLPVTFYHNEDLDKMPAFTDYAMAGRTYRYMDFAPRYPFGYGLTYGDSRMLSAAVTPCGDGCIVHASFKNEGGCDTEDVVQVYVQNEGSGNSTKNPRLCGFARVFCRQGETGSVDIPVDAKRLTVVDEEGRRLMEGKPVFYVGFGQPDACTKALTGQDCIRVVME